MAELENPIFPEAEAAIAEGEPKVGLFRRVGHWCKRVRAKIAPGRRAWKGAALGLLAATAILWVVFSYPLLATPSANYAGLIVFGAVLAFAALSGALLLGIFALLGSLPAFYGWALASALVMLILLSLFLGPLGITVGVLTVIVFSSLFGAGIWVLARGGFRGATAGRRWMAIGGAVLGAAAIVAGTIWLLADGWPAKPVPDAAARAAAKMKITPLALPDPSQPGEYKVRTLFYGSGDDRRRPEYGPKVNLRTKPVDGSRLIERWDGPAGWARTRYWGFDAKRLPIQGRVWYPDGRGPFPLVLVVHGNHLMESFSDPGYQYLGELLAGRGYILVSVDENFLNSSLADLLGIPKPGLKEENDARGWLLLEHLRVWRAWNETPGNPFHHKVDMDNIGLIGHSRGGEAVAVAAVFNRLPYYPDNARVSFDYQFHIRSVVAIAPVDGQYKPAGVGTKPENVNYFVLHGSLDGDMQSFHGSRVYERVRFTDGSYWFKATVYIHGANHGQFNTAWGRADYASLPARFLNLKQIMPARDQERIAKVYISAFLEATLRGRKGYVPLFRDHRVAARWLPGVIYLQKFEDSTCRQVATYDEDIDVTTTAMPGGKLAGTNLCDWREKEVKIKWGSLDTRAVYLGWNSKEAPGVAAYAVTLPEKGLTLDKESVLVFSLADAKEEPSPYQEDKKDKKKAEKKKETQEEKEKKRLEPIDLTIEAVDNAGAAARLPLSSFSFLQPQIEVRVLKAAFLSSVEPSEVVFQSFEFPLSAFAGANPSFDPARLKMIRFIFDRTPAGVVILDNLGFRVESKSQPFTDRAGFVATELHQRR